MDAGSALLTSLEKLVEATGADSVWMRAMGTVRNARLMAGTTAGDPVIASVRDTAVLASCDIHVRRHQGRWETVAYAVIGFDASGSWSTRAGRLTYAEAEDVTVVAIGAPGSAAAGPPTAGAVAASPAAAIVDVAVPTPVRTPAVSVAPSRSDSLSSGPDSPRASLARFGAGEKLDARPAPPRSSQPPATSSPTGTGAGAWDRLAAYSAGVEDDDEDNDDEIDVDDLRPNDRLMHPKLGELRFLSALPDGSANVELIAQKVTRKLKMSAFVIVKPAEDPGKGPRRFALRLRNEA